MSQLSGSGGRAYEAKIKFTVDAGGATTESKRLTEQLKSQGQAAAAASRELDKMGRGGAPGRAGAPGGGTSQAHANTLAAGTPGAAPAGRAPGAGGGAGLADFGKVAAGLAIAAHALEGFSRALLRSATATDLVGGRQTASGRRSFFENANDVPILGSLFRGGFQIANGSDNAAASAGDLRWAQEMNAWVPIANERERFEADMRTRRADNRRDARGVYGSAAALEQFHQARGEASTAFRSAQEAQDRAAAMRNRLRGGSKAEDYSSFGGAPAMSALAQSLALRAAETDAIEKSRTAQEAYNRVIEKQGTLLKSQQGGALEFALMSDWDKQSLVEITRRANTSGIESLSVEERARYLGSSINPERARQQAVAASERDPAYLEALRIQGQPSPQSIRDAIAQSAGVKVNVVVDEAAQRRANAEAIDEIFNKLKDLFVKQGEGKIRLAEQEAAAARVQQRIGN